MFSNTAKVEWVPDHPRDMVLLEDLSFTDKAGKVWAAPAGSRINGASIPRILWTFQGSPFVGSYRRASVVHDVYCDTKTEPHSAVHKVFLEMMLADGVDPSTAYRMFIAVIVFGPKW